MSVIQISKSPDWPHFPAHLFFISSLAPTTYSILVHFHLLSARLSIAPYQLYCPACFWPPFACYILTYPTSVYWYFLLMLCLLPCFHSYKRVVTPRRAGTAVLLCWMVSIIVGLTPMLGWNNLKRLRDNSSMITDDLLVTCEFETVISMEYMVYFNFFGWVLPPLLLMLAIYVEIFYMIHKQLNKKVRLSSYCAQQI